MTNNYQFTRVVTKPVTIQQETHETATLPVLDLTAEAVLEVLDSGRGTVILNGVILKGASLRDIKTTRNYWGKNEGSAVLLTPIGNVTLAVTQFVNTVGFSPTTVEWKKKPAEMIRPAVFISELAQGWDKGVCCAPSCGLAGARACPDYQYRCQRHTEDKYGSFSNARRKW